MPRQALWDFPLLSAFLGRGKKSTAAQQPSTYVGVPATELTPAVPAPIEVSTVTPEGDVVTVELQQPTYVVTYTTAAGIGMDVYKNPNTGKYDAVCPEHPFYDKKGEFRSAEDARWYIEEVAMGSSTENAAAVAAAAQQQATADAAAQQQATYVGVPATTAAQQQATTDAAVAKFKRSGFI